MVVTNLLRAGIVSAVIPERCAVVVAFSDKDNLVSRELPVLVPKTLQTKYFRLPDVNESVLCGFLGNGIETGFCLGAFYTSVDTPPAETTNCQGVWFDDGSFCMRDTATGKMTVLNKGDIVLHPEGGAVVIEGDLRVTGQIYGDGYE
ncbi:phage baseplate assembly protein V [Tumebacillus permanentifrigoris]|uniref:Phage baseplate assembly protein V n=1 Tax=Tumebacillus permanentifrigoris TaxID=378543 RepID=A0A316DEP5_9BACL|nr:phage baseplate assembly protein V [Tumebacillus permanentifrigoris]PWK16058.1 phage baseplate assembly protein V [Tumebacillus permanentifrigoris]